LLLFLLLALHLLASAAKPHTEQGSSPGERVFVEVSGDVLHRGVYAFETLPDVGSLLSRAGEPLGIALQGAPSGPRRFRSGSHIRFTWKDGKVALDAGEMSAFFRVTLGLPILLNRESPEGLTAIPGIGPKTAEAIVLERGRIGGFRRIEDLRSVPGIGPALLQTIRPWVVLNDGGAPHPVEPGAAPPADGRTHPLRPPPASHSAASMESLPGVVPDEGGT